jgi:hypothetical protein
LIFCQKKRKNNLGAFQMKKITFRRFDWQNGKGFPQPSERFQKEKKNNLPPYISPKQNPKGLAC